VKVDIFNTNKRYSIIYADPPWSFSSKELQKYSGKRFRSLEVVYNTEKTSSMAEWNVSRIADTDCALFMWTTDAHLEEAIQLMKAWGFKYVTIAFVWSKVTKNGKQVSNLGAWTMKNCEICLFGTKGKMLKYKKSNSVKQLFEAERTKHSKKPDCVRGFIEELFGDIPRIELFARQYADGWDCWGNEV
jgi:N6-adenosine-specific RNA methylase IME4